MRRSQTDGQPSQVIPDTKEAWVKTDGAKEAAFTLFVNFSVALKAGF